MDIKICIMVSIEYIIYLIYPILGGLSDAYTQYQNLYLLQIVTVTGIYGITFLMYWTAVMVIWIWNNKSKKEYIRKYIIVYGSVIGLVFVYGVVMFHFAVAFNPQGELISEYFKYGRSIGELCQKEMEY